MSGNAAVFIDAGYFDRVARDCGSPRIDFGRLAAELARPDALLRAYYYGCLPYLSPVPTPDEEERFEGKRRFFSAMNRLNRFEVREGKLEYRGTDRESSRPIFEQKRVDIHLGVDLVLLAVKQRIHRAILITGDSDFLPAIRAAKNEGVVIHLFHGAGPQQPHRDLWEEVDERAYITPELLSGFLLSDSPTPSANAAAPAKGRGFGSFYSLAGTHARAGYPSGRGWPDGLPVVDGEEEA